MTMFKPALRCAAALAALGLSTAAAADALVVRSTGPSAASYPVGRRLPDTERVVLRTGDRVVIVAQGGTRTLSGPGNFPVRATVQTTQGRSTTLNRYLSASGGSISRTGAVRGSVQQLTPPSLWVVDIAGAGPVCSTDIGNVTLWRADMSQDALLMVENTANPEVKTSLAFVAGANFRRWPVEEMPVVAGQSYRFTGTGMGESSVITFVEMPLPAEDASTETIATALAERNCMGQLAQLGARLEEGNGN